MDSLSAAQQAAVLAVLRAALSEQGYTQVVQIMTADGVLVGQGGPQLDFGADHYGSASGCRRKSAGSAGPVEGA